MNLWINSYILLSPIVMSALPAGDNAQQCPKPHITSQKHTRLFLPLNEMHHLQNLQKYHLQKISIKTCSWISHPDGRRSHFYQTGLYHIYLEGKVRPWAQLCPSAWPQGHPQGWPGHPRAAMLLCMFGRREACCWEAVAGRWRPWGRIRLLQTPNW